MDKAIENLTVIKNKIAAVCERTGRDPVEIEILAASKGVSADRLSALNETGEIKAFGENRVQELLSKYRPELTFDMIGQLQSNKVKYIIDKVRLIHSVDRMSLLEEIDRQANKHGKIQDILIEINTGNEENKGGIRIEDGEAFAKLVENFQNVKLAGLMAVAPLGIEPEDLKKLFSGVNELYGVLKEKHPDVRYLSMGMSNDYEIAVECGSNMLRLGRALFGSA